MAKGVQRIPRCRYCGEPCKGICPERLRWREAATQRLLREREVRESSLDRFGFSTLSPAQRARLISDLFG